MFKERPGERNMKISPLFATFAVAVGLGTAIAGEVAEESVFKGEALEIVHEEACEIELLSQSDLVSEDGIITITFSEQAMADCKAEKMEAHQQRLESFDTLGDIGWGIAGFGMLLAAGTIAVDSRHERKPQP